MVAAACSRGGDAVPIEASADAGGIDIRASSRVVEDSLRVRVRLTNLLDTSADITLNGGCPITVIAYEAEAGVVWDEREGRTCEESDIHVPFAPGEVKDLYHSVPRSADPSLAAADSSGLGVRVLVAVDEEYLLEAAPR